LIGRAPSGEEFQKPKRLGLNLDFTILHTEWSQGWGGQEMRIVAESAAFRHKGYNMMIACHPDSEIYKEAQAAGVPTIPLRIRHGMDLSALIRFVGILRLNCVNLVHTHSSPDAWVCGMAASLTRVPVVRSRHLSTPISPGYPSYFLYMKLANRVITSGQTIKDVMVQHNRMLPERIVSIPAGIEVSRFLPGTDPTPVRREFRLRADDFVIGIVAVLRSWKGHQYLIEAVHTLVERGFPAKLLIVGTGPQERNIRKKIQRLKVEGHVLLTGYRKDVPTLMSAMNCMVLPSTGNEATSQVLPQALAMKVPVLATNVGGIPEVVINYRTGLLVPPRDPRALSEALIWIYEHPQKAAAMAEEGYHHIRANFTFDKMIERTEQVYLNLL
jgi:glycosyltransferase involved in cell wall biosynthesis